MGVEEIMKFLKMPYAEVANRGTHLSVKNMATEELYFMLLQAQPDEVDEALAYATVNPWVTGIEYLGSPNDLVMRKEKIGSTYIYCIVDAQNLHDVVPDVNLVVRTPANYANMQYIKTMCEKHPNVSFIGGDFLKLQGVRLGEVPDDKLPRKSFIKKARILFSGNDCSALEIEDYTNYLNVLSFGNEPYKYGETKSSSGKGSSAKKATKSSNSGSAEKKAPKGKAFVITGGLSNF